jgi:hypothetical protein
VEREREQAAPAPEVLAAPASAAAEPALEQRVLALQRSAGNRAVSRMIAARQQLARWSIPLVGGVPAGTRSTTLADFLDIIRAVEAKFPADATNTSLMITRLRKLFYGTPGWESHLIPGAASIAPVYTVTERETGRRDLEWDLWPYSLEYVDKVQENDVPTSEGATLGRLRHPSDIQEVLMPNGDFVDVGHVFAGLDAINHPTSVAGPAGSYRVSSNVDAVTWVGDLGSILAEVVFDSLHQGRALTDSEVQHHVDVMAPVQDMLGNVDAYAIGKAYAVGATSGRRVSEILEEYYNSGAGTVGTTARSRRFTTFASEIGLTGFSGGHFAGEAAWLAKYEVEVGNAAALYLGAGVHIKGYVNPWGVGGLGGALLGLSTNPFRRTVVEEFLNQLRLRVAAETPASAPAATP